MIQQSIRKLFFSPLVGLTLVSLFGMGCRDVPPDAVPPDAAIDEDAALERSDLNVVEDMAMVGSPCDNPTRLDDDAFQDGPTLSAGCYLVEDDIRVSRGELIVDPGATLLFASSGSLSISEGASIRAVGTAEDPIVFSGLNQTRGYWKGLRLENSTAMDNQLIHAVIEYAGGAQWSGAEYSRAGLYLKGDNVQARVEHTTFRFNSGAGVLADGDDARIHVSTSHFEQNDVSIKIQPNLAGSLGPDLSFMNNDVDAISLEGKDTGRGVVKPQTWASHAAPYLLPSTVEVNAELAIDAGSRLIFGQNSGLKIENDGRLIAVGTEMEPIRMGGQEEGRGYWKGLFFQNSRSMNNQLVYVTVSGGGSEAWTRDEGSRGGLVVLDGVALTVNDSHFLQNAGTAMLFRSLDLDLILENTRADDNEAPIIIVAGSAHLIGDNNEFTGNDRDYIQLGLPDFTFEREVSGTVTWRDLGLPYLLSRELIVSGRLTIEAGVQMEFEANIGIEVERGSLTIGQAGAARTRLGPRAGEQAPGFWKGIAYVSAPSGENRIANADLISAGSQSWGGTVRGQAAVYLARGSRSARLAIDDVTIAKSGALGISVESESTVAPCSGLNFSDNVGDDVYLGDTATYECQ